MAEYQEVYCEMTVATEADTSADELVLEPPSPVPSVSSAQAAATIKVDDATAARISAAVTAYIDSLTNLEAQSPEFERKVGAISRMGREEMRRSAEASSRFLDRPTAALKQGPMTEGSQVSTALVALRQQVEDLDPSRHLQQRRGIFKRVPFGAQVNDYFRRYQSSQQHIEAIVSGLYRGQDELMRDNAALEQERVHLWAIKTRLEQYAHMAAALDEALTRKIATYETSAPEKARALKEDALFYVRQKRQDLLTQLSVVVQGYLATAVIAALALGNQKLVLDQVTALNTTTGNIIESTSQMLRQQTLEIAGQAANSTISIEKLQAAFNNIYATIDTIDTFKLAALENMRKTIDSLSSEVARAQQYVERARSADLAQSSPGCSGCSAPPGRCCSSASASGCSCTTTGGMPVASAGTVVPAR